MEDFIVAIFITFVLFFGIYIGLSLKVDDCENARTNDEIVEDIEEKLNSIDEDLEIIRNAN